MTPAVDQLEKLALPYTLHQYQHETHCKSFGVEAIDKLNVSADLVFKTLVVDVDNSYLAVAIIPALMSTLLLFLPLVKKKWQDNCKYVRPFVRQ